MHVMDQSFKSFRFGVGRLMTLVVQDTNSLCLLFYPHVQVICILLVLVFFCHLQEETQWGFYLFRSVFDMQLVSLS